MLAPHSDAALTMVPMLVRVTPAEMTKPRIKVANARLILTDSFK
jgi:hypothetical protein